MVRNFALVIGINHYEHIPKNKHLKCAVRDAEAMRDFLLEVGFLKENILLCTEDLIEEQTGDLIQEKIVIS
ncbi:MAG: caspase family protein [Coleofasciculaceae cyanobacterium SM2_1_6]|nr:caspase family protein [Coleofasciculaceae cyanobacterium SM2_1_6]